MGAGLDDDGRKLLRMDQYLDLGSNGFKSWVCGGMDSCLWIHAYGQVGRCGASQTAVAARAPMY